MNVKGSTLAALCGLAAGVASAQPIIVTGAGATLQEDFFRSAASTNDFIDADGDGIAGVNNSFAIDQLAGSNFSSAFLVFHYHIVGSGSGIQSFDLYAGGFDQQPDNDFDAPLTPENGRTPDSFASTTNPFILPQTGAPASVLDQIPGNSAFTESIWNRDNLVIAGVLQTGMNGPGNSNHRSGAPLVPQAPSYQGQLLNLGNTGNGFTVDFSTSDVPLGFFTNVPSASDLPRADNVPGVAAYGVNNRLATDKDGNPINQGSTLASLARLNTNTGNPDGFTAYPFGISVTPVAAIVNYGVGLESINQSDLRHLLGTGRRLVGENLMNVSRDPTSGTHNSFHNSMGLDPAFGVSENIGLRSTSSSTGLLGPDFQPTNRGGSSRVEEAVRNHRLAIGHTGASRGLSSNRWFVTGWGDVLGIENDLLGGDTPVRPTNLTTLGIDSVSGGVITPLANPANSYAIVGNATWTILGDPRAADPSDGGFGFTAAEAAQPVNPFAGNPTPPNPGATLYFNNVLRSIEAFQAIPNAPENDFQPGENLAANFVLTAAPLFTQTTDPAPLTQVQPLPFQANANNAALTLNRATDASDPLAQAVYQNFNTLNTSGYVPTRTSGETYSDNNAGDFYTDEAGNQVPYTPLSTVVNDATGAANQGLGGLAPINRISFDFNGDGLRNAADATGIVQAFNERNGGGNTYQPANGQTVIEIIGDGDGDGSFTIEDVRYFADGLVLVDNGLDILPVLGQDNVGGDGVIDSFVIGDGVIELTLDREEGFEAIDDASLAETGNLNFFGTTLATGAAYKSGDSRADVAGEGQTANFRPNGADGVVNAADIDYVRANFGDWTDLNEAILVTGTGTADAVTRVMDLSADMDGDLEVDEDDVLIIINEVLETVLGDVNLDGMLDDADRAIVEANQGLMGAGYADGDIDGDGDVDADDLAFVAGGNPLDFDGNGVVNISDLFAFITAFTATPPAPTTDFDGNGVINISDLFAFITAFTATP